MKHFLRLPLAAALLASATAMAAPAGGNLVTNGDFEQDMTGWTIQAGDFDLVGSQCAPGNPSAYAGDCSAYFGSFGKSGISQSVNLGQAGQAWNLSFAFQPDGGVQSSITVRFGDDLLMVMNRPAPGAYQVYSFIGVASAANQLLSFEFTSPVGILFLDSVSVTAVPEPATLGMMAAGLAGLAFLRRRRVG